MLLVRQAPWPAALLALLAVQDRPGSSQEPPRANQERPKIVQERPKSSQERPKTTPRAILATQDVPESLVFLMFFNDF